MFAARQIAFGKSVIENQSLQYLCFTAEDAGAEFKLQSRNGPAITLEISPTGEEGSWQPYNVGDNIILENIGDKIMFRNSSDEIQAMSTSGSTYNYFNINSGKIAASGNIMFLMDKTGEFRDLSNYESCFHSLFSNCASLVKAPELPATILSIRCYAFLFNRCTSLTQAPTILPATTLKDWCYASMFHTCTSLIQAPELPATTLTTRCYNAMFYNDSSLNYVKCGLTSWNPSTGTSNWLNNVKSSGTFTCPTALPANRGASYIPTGWTIVRK